MDTSDFLNQDFLESHNQLRHYDSTILDSFKFIFSIYIALIGGSISLLNIEKKIDFTILIQVLITFSIILCVFVLFYIIEQRLYFVKTARYLNEIRNYFLENNQVDFKNNTQYYIDYSKPDYFNLKSSHIILTIIISVLNSFNIGLFIYVVNNCWSIWMIFATILSVVIHITIIFLMLNKK